MNNFEKIKAMSVKEFADFIFRKTGINCALCDGNKLFCVHAGGCAPEHIEKWLESEEE